MISAAIDLRSTIARALEQAQAEEAEGDTLGKLHRDRSRRWVEALGRVLREFYGVGVCVFTKHFRDNRDAFGLNELLYDVCVCDTAETNEGSKSYRYITKCRWQI